MPQRIASVSPRSLAQRHGITAGEQLVSINGIPVLDLVDYQYLISRPDLAVEVEALDGQRRTLHIHKHTEESLGLTLESGLMSHPNTCANHCIFCFIEQMPPHMRESLYVRDDDWRLSLMAGNFVTLTNMPESEIRRIIERRASPIYISVHTTNPELRRQMLHNRRADQILTLLERFASNGICFHCQIVLCPGINDGAELERTLSDLSAFIPHALSAALVPVGLTRFREHLTPLRPYTREEARAVIRTALTFQETLLRRHGTRFVFPSDEFFRIADLPIPEDEAYEDYPQYENGVGLLRRLYVEFEEAYRDLETPRARPRRVLIATGTSFAPFLQDMLETFPLQELQVEVLPVVNRFFGETVTVTGLLTAGDVLEQIRGHAADELLISETMLRSGEDVFLDNVTLEAFEEAACLPVRVVLNDGGDLLCALLGQDPESEAP